MVTRGEVWLAALDPTVSSEIQKTPPCPIISRPKSMTICAQFASHPAGFRIPVAFQGINGLILLEHSRVLDRKRLVKRLGTVLAAVLKQTLRTLRELYGE